MHTREAHPRSPRADTRGPRRALLVLALTPPRHSGAASLGAAAEAPLPWRGKREGGGGSGGRTPFSFTVASHI